MTREVYRKSYARSDDTKYHLFEDCYRLEQARAWRPFDLDALREDTVCCAMCIKRAFLRKEAFSVCDADAHALDLATLDAECSVQWPCPEGGFTDEVPADIFREKLASAGIGVDDVRDAAETLDMSGDRGPQLASRLEKMDADELVTDGGVPVEDIPDHPLHGYEHLLDTHEGHLQAFSHYLGDADPDDIRCAMLVLNRQDGTDTIPTLNPTAEAEDEAWYGLAAHIGHVAQTFDAHPADVAKHAVHVLLDQGPESQDVMTDGGHAGIRVDGSLTFDAKYAHPIKMGRKSATVRYHDVGDVRPGQAVRAVTEDGDAFDLLRIDAMADCRASQALSVIEAFGATYPTENTVELLDGVNDHYDAEIGPATGVQVVSFYRIKERDPP